MPTLRVGTSGDYAPFSDRGVGFDVEVANRLADDLGMELAWVPFEWPQLRDRVAEGAFDVAMGGVTWRPGRAVLGWMSRAVASGGPCVLGRAEPTRLGVNRGGILERWARRRFSAARIETVDDNLSLPELLARGEVDAIVTDSFELATFRRRAEQARADSAHGPSDLRSRCQPPVDRKVYWVSPRADDDLAPRIEAWLAANEHWLDGLRQRWLGGSAPRSEEDHLLDLLARRLALMPAVVRTKRARGLAIEDRPREQRVLAAVRERARAEGLEPGEVESLFRLLIEQAKAVQARSDPDAAAPSLDLESELRPTLGRLGARIVRSLGRLAPLDAEALTAADWEPVAVYLESEPRQLLRERLLAIGRVDGSEAAAGE